MSQPWILMVGLLLLPVVLLLGFAGCVGDDVARANERADAAERERDESDKKREDAEQHARDLAAEKAEADRKAAEEAAAREAARYFNVVLAEPDLVCYWRLDDPAPSTVAKDSAPNDVQHGEYKGDAGITRGQPGALTLGKEAADKAVHFDGVHGYVEVAHDAVLNPFLEFSVEAWVRPGGVSPDPQVVLASYEVDPATAKLLRGFVLEVIPSSTPKVRARVGDPLASTTLEADLGDGLEHDAWRHVVMTYDNAAKELKLYVNAENGQSDANVGSLAAPVHYTPNQTSPLRIAAGQVEGPSPQPTAARLFHGRIDEVALYRKPLTGTQVKAHFGAGINP